MSARPPRKEIDQHRLRLRNLTIEDYPDIKEIMDLVYPGFGGAWSEKKFNAMLTRFPAGQLCVEDNGKVVAAALSVIVDYSRFGDSHTYDQITGKGFLTTHDPDGDVLYGVDVFVHPDYRDLRLGRRLYDSRKELCRNLNLRAIVAGGRIPGYESFASELSPHEYIEKVSRKEIYDPILTFQLSNDFEVKRLLTNYLPADKMSHGYATLLEWSNIYYNEKPESLLKAKKSIVRVGVVQWQMRLVSKIDALLHQVEYFIDALSYYKADFVVFPEFFNAAMLGLFDQDNNQVEAIRKMAEYTNELKQTISQYAVSYNTNVIAGSLPVVDNNELYNEAFLCRRDGTIEGQRKLHITPSEYRSWSMSGGDKLKIFDTDAGKIGILICFDVEFPELARMLADQGMQILFVPFWTDTKNGFLRVQRCAQARAIENECYVAISGSVGNLPKIDNAEIQYAQSAVYSPSDFAFPHDAIMAESTPNTEMTLIVDLDLDKLEHLRLAGSVQNLTNRRQDLYQLQWTNRTKT